jgi:hypothetical protein
MFDPSGQLRDIPPEKVGAATQAGGEPAVLFDAPDGNQRWVRQSQRDQAIQAGGKVHQGLQPQVAASQSPSAPAAKPGFFSRLASAVGIPTSMSQVQGMIGSIPNTLNEISAGTDNPNLPAGPVKQYMQNLAQQTGAATTGVSDAVKNIQAGQPVGPNAGKIASHGLELLNRGVLGPVGGEALQTGGEDVMSHMAPGQTVPGPGAMLHGDVAGDFLGSLVNALTLDKLRGPSTEASLNKLTYATGPKAATPLENTLGMLRDTASAQNVNPNTVGGLRDLVNKTKTNINTEYGNAIGPYSNMKLVPTEVSSRILALATPDMPYTAEGRADLAAIKSAATEYQQPWTLGALDSKRSRLAADLASHNAKEGVARYTAERGNINLAIDNTVNDSLRDTVYPQADALAGQPTGYFEDLKQKQSNLIRLEQILNKRIEDLQGAQRAQRGAPLGGQIHAGAYLTPGGGHAYIGNLINYVRNSTGGGPMTSANKATAAAFSTGSPVAKGIVMSYPIRALSLEPSQWWDQPQQ